MSSLWNNSTLSRIIIPAGSSRSAIYEPDENGFDVGGILAAANNEVPLIDPKHLKYDKSLGSGTTFDVHRELFRPANPHASPYFVAVKYMRLAGKTAQTKQAMSRSLMREIKVMTRPALNSHGCIVPLLGYGWRNDPRDGAIPYLITDYSEYGTLKDYLGMITTSLPERRELALDVAVGLETLHESSIIHGDVKLSNVLVYGISGRFISSRPQSAKLADFGSTLLEEDFARHSGTSRYYGTPAYNPPEFQGVDGSGDCATFLDCTRADVYSFGLLAWETMAGGKSYCASITAVQAHESIPTTPKSDQVLQQLLKTAEISASSSLHEVLRLTLEGCLRDDPKKRKAMSEVTGILSQGAESSRVEPEYPLSTTGPLTHPNWTSANPNPPLNYYVRSSEPHIAIPSPARLQTGQAPYIQRYDPVTNEWKPTMETDPYVFSGRIVADPPLRPEASHFEEPQIPVTGLHTANLLVINPRSSPPWDVQLSIFNSLLPDARLEKELTKRCYSRLQLAACYHIGFGCDSDGEHVIGHLEGAVECDRTAQALYPQTIEALIELQDQSQRLNTSTPSEDMQRPSAELPYHYKVAVASLSIRLGSSMTKVRVGGDEWQSLIDFHEELNRSWTQNCEFVELCGTDGRVVKKNMFQHLLDLTKHPSTGTKLLNLHDGTGDMAFDEPQPTWNNWPTPMHWLISMPDSYLTSLTEALLRPATSSKVCTAHMVNYERSTQDVFMLPDLGIELFGTPLHWAVRCRNLPLATVLLDHGADINARWFRRLPLVNDRIDEKRPLSYSALDIAVMWHFPELVKLLLSRNAETYGGYHYEKHHCVNLIGAPVPMFARHVAHGIMVRSALISTIRVLEESGQSLDQKNSSGESTFSLALEVCDQEVYILETLRLRSWTADQRLLERLLHSVCKDAAVRRSRTERLRILLPLVDDPNAVDDRGLSALHHASLASGASHVQILLNDARVKPTMFTKDGHSALTLAAQAGAESTITAAWEAGVDVEQCDKNGRAPLQCALEARQTSLAVQMIQILRVSVSWSCNELEHPSSALFSATRSRERETSILKDLLDECPILQTLEVLNERTANNWTVLHQAAWYGDFQGVHALIEAGASRTIASTRGAGRRRKGTPYEVVALHLASLKSLGEDGWKLNSISWIEHGGRARWAAYLDELSKISDHLAR